MAIPKRVKIIEVGPRDGLQNEHQVIPTEVKIELINRLGRAGFVNIEAASFVSPKWVPQMADSTAVINGIERRPGVTYSALTPNLKGFEAALACKIDEVVIFGSASEAFCQKNLNCSIPESIERFRVVAEAARRNGIGLRGAVSCAFGCPYQGDVSAEAAADVVCRLRDLGCSEIDLADTIGVGTPRKVQAAFERAAQNFPVECLMGHFHDTYGQGIANVFASLEVGVSIFHSSIGGLGGCPFAKGATGNVATEDVLYLMEGLGIETGVDLKAVVEAGQFISEQLGRRAVSRAGNALAAKFTACSASC